MDLKTTIPKSDHASTYSRQLHAYATALEHPAAGRSAVVRCLGLLCFLPESYRAEVGVAGIFGEVQWIKVTRDDSAFAEFLECVGSVLSQPEPPPAAPGCPWCARASAVAA